eukprot:3857060-Pleurochrysis_carterae.AAC.1
MGPRGSQSGGPGAGRLPPVAEVCAGGPPARPLSTDGTTDAEVVPSAAQAHSAAAPNTDAGRNTGIPGRTPAQHDAASCTPGEDPSRQL